MIAYLSPHEALHSHSPQSSQTWARATGLTLAAAVHAALIFWLVSQTFRTADLVDRTPSPPPMTVQEVDLNPQSPTPKPTSAPANDSHTSSTIADNKVDTLPIKVASAHATNSVTVNPFVSQGAGSALITGTPTIAHTLTNPDWISRPSADQIAKAYPEEDIRAGIDGMAMLTCQVTSAGHVTGCRVSSETPEGRGFGRAALGLTPYFRIRPGTDNGEPTDGASVLIPIRFQISG